MMNESYTVPTKTDRPKEMHGVDVPEKWTGYGRRNPKIWTVRMWAGYGKMYPVKTERSDTR